MEHGDRPCHRGRRSHNCASTRQCFRHRGANRCQRASRPGQCCTCSQYRLYACRCHSAGPNRQQHSCHCACGSDGISAGIHRCRINCTGFRSHRSACRDSCTGRDARL